MHKFKKIFFCFVCIKWLKLVKKHGKNGVEGIIFNGKKLLNENHIETQLKHSNLVAVTNKYSLKLTKKDKITILWKLSTL